MSLPDSSERAQQLGWSHETRPEIGKLDPDLAGRFGFGQVRRVGALPAYRSDGATVVWMRPDLDWSALLETQSEFDAGFTPVVIPEDMFNLALQRAFERSGAAADVVQDLDQVIDLESLSTDLLDSGTMRRSYAC